MKHPITGGEAMVLAAKANGIDRIFGIPGAQIYPLFDALKRHNIETIVPRHEQGAAYMAMGAARSTGKPTAFSVVPGPGVLNTVAALCTAMGTCTPVLCLTGQIPSTFLGKGRGHLHELADQSGTLKTIIKDAVRIDHPEQTSTVMNRAFRTLGSHRPGPVSVEMCWDTMAKPWDVEIAAGNTTLDKPTLEVDQLKAAAKAIAAARNPMIFCGSGALDAGPKVQALAELLQCPVTAFRSGRGVVSEDHPLGIAAVAARLLWDDCDLVIGIGTRLEMPYMRWSSMEQYRERPNDGRTLIRIDISSEEMQRFIPDVGVVADAAEACAALVNELENKVTRCKDRVFEIAAAKTQSLELVQKIQPQMGYLNVIRELLPRDGFFVPELSQVGFASWYGFPVYKARTFVNEGYQGTLGFGFSTALGVKVANPDKAVISVNGDGGFMFGLQELATAAAHNIGLITLVFNNQAYGNVHRDQLQGFDGRLIASELKNPDFVKVAESFAVKGVRVSSPEALKPVLAKAIDDNRPILIEVMQETGSEASPWEFIHMRQSPLSP